MKFVEILTRNPHSKSSLSLNVLRIIERWEIKYLYWRWSRLAQSGERSPTIPAIQVQIQAAANRGGCLLGSWQFLRGTSTYQIISSSKIDNRAIESLGHIIYYDNHNRQWITQPHDDNFSYRPCTGECQLPVSSKAKTIRVLQQKRWGPHHRLWW